MSKELEFSELISVAIEQSEQPIGLDDISLALIGGGELTVSL